MFYQTTNLAVAGSPELILHLFNNIFIACYFRIRNIFDKNRIAQ